MVMDIEAIKKKVAELNGKRTGGDINYWWPEEGEHKVRALPWKQGVDDGVPILERYFYKIGQNKRALAPHQFGQPDPINDYVIALYKKKTDEDKAIAKKLRAKATGYLPVVLRTNEGEGVKVYSFSSFLSKRLLSFWLNNDIGDITDPLDGYDLDIVLAPNGKFWKGKQNLDTTIDAVRKSTPLHTDKETAQKWLDSVPDLDGFFKKFNTKTSAELEQQLHEWLKSGDEVAADEQSDGTAKGKETSSDALDKLADDINAKPAKKAPVEVDEADEKPAVKKSTKKSLDDAFAELEEDD